MNPTHTKPFSLSAKPTPSQILFLIQKISDEHSTLLGTGQDVLAQKGLFWAVARHRVQISRLPAAGETLVLETWPMPTTRTAYPRCVIASDTHGNLLFRAVSLWVLMHLSDRTLVLPEKSGVAVDGCLTGRELTLPGSFPPVCADHTLCRTVLHNDLDSNGHMNNCRYLDWCMDLLPAGLQKERCPTDFSISYLSEAREGDSLKLCWQRSSNGTLCLDGTRDAPLSTGRSRVFSLRMQF